MGLQGKLAIATFIFTLSVSAGTVVWTLSDSYAQLRSNTEQLNHFSKNISTINERLSKISNVIDSLGKLNDKVDDLNNRTIALEVSVKDNKDTLKKIGSQLDGITHRGVAESTQSDTEVTVAKAKR